MNRTPHHHLPKRPLTLEPAPTPTRAPQKAAPLSSATKRRQIGSSFRRWRGSGASP
jgi:hypothetical protein